MLLVNVPLCPQFPGNVDAGSETAGGGTSAARKSHELCQAQDQSAACYVSLPLEPRRETPGGTCCLTQRLYVFAVVAALG